MHFHRLNPVAINLFLANGQMDTPDEDTVFCIHYTNVSKNGAGCYNTEFKCRYIVPF